MNISGLPLGVELYGTLLVVALVLPPILWRLLDYYALTGPPHGKFRWFLADSVIPLRGWFIFLWISMILITVIMTYLSIVEVR